MGCLCKRKKPIKENNILDSISIENIKLKKVVMDDFDEEKAKELAKELLSIDLQFYRNQSKHIRQSFPSDRFLPVLLKSPQFYI